MNLVYWSLMVRLLHSGMGWSALWFGLENRLVHKLWVVTDHFSDLAWLVGVVCVGTITCKPN